MNKINVFLLLVFTCIAGANAASYHTISVTNYQLKGSSGDETEDWVDLTFADPIVYETQEVRYQSPKDKEFSIDISGLANAKNKRQELKALLNWGGFELGFEQGSAQAQFKTTFNQDEVVAIGDPLPTGCVKASYYCLEKIAVTPGKKIEMQYDLTRIGFNANGLMFGYMMWDYQIPVLLQRDVSDVSQTQGGWVPNQGAYYYSFNNQEEWGSLIDTEATFKFHGFYLGMDFNQYRLQKARSSGETLHHGFSGRYLLQAGSYKIETSGKAEAELDAAYGSDYSGHHDFKEEQNFGYDLGLSYMFVLTINENQGFLEIGYRYNQLSDFVIKQPSSSAYYDMTSLGVTDFYGYYLGVGATF